MQIKLKVLVNSYITYWRSDELEFYRSQSSLADAIKKATLAVDACDKRQSHQRRLQQRAMEEGRDALMQCKKAVDNAKSFDELHSIVERAVLPIAGLGELYAYDTALRIEARLCSYPTPHLLISS
ncbi:MAG TPA: hypothetical protein VNW97_13420 [Candidatus Saccharimonadales bacterium]|jgi:hypothetical protein|nr:hypothetical protein [Candidatus Saccharimonadales bacterium]